MLSPDKVAIVIPCFNEADEISTLVQEARKIVPHVFVIDDGSTDRTAELAQAAGADVFSNEKRLGKGASMLRGLKIALARGFDWALLMDGDGQHAPADILNFLHADGNYPLVIGNRMHDEKRMPWLRKTVNCWMSDRISNLAGVHLPDTQCGFRLANLSVWNRLRFETRQFEMESEMVLAFLAAGCHVKFVPVQTIYRNEKSKIRPFSDTIRWLRWFLRAKRRFNSQSRQKHAAIKNKNLQTVR
ncbi:MAG: glycosyltransferase family 2 protein [Verrucomicrobia bacterium]|nr:glycosyltransferase family 2 protein [Verrucomicrobiota bacterium]